MSLVQLIFAALLVLANGFFVGAEFALVSVRRSQVEPLAAAGSSRARQVSSGLPRVTARGWPRPAPRRRGAVRRG